MAEEHFERPPIRIEENREIIVRDNLEFADSCKALVAEEGSGHNWALGKDVITKSRDWGEIWRVDFEIVGKDVKPLVNRITCWRDKGSGELNLSISFGQDIPPI